MPLIKCPECQSEISDQAPSCPKCGFPLGRANTQNVQTVQLTTKKWKIMKLVSAGFLLIGAILFILGISLDLPGVGIDGMLLLIIGIILLIVVKFGAWWTNR